MSRLADAVAGGWEIATILTFSAGYPIVTGLGSPKLWDGAAQRANNSRRLRLPLCEGESQD